MATTRNNYLFGLIAFVVMVIVDFALWRVFFAPTNGVFKLFTPLYGLSLAAFFFYAVILIADVFGYRNEQGSIGKGLALLGSALVFFYVAYYIFFWNILGRFGVTYFSPQALIDSGGTGLEIWNARENASLAILYVATALIWVTDVWNAGLGDTPWEGLKRPTIGMSKFFATAFCAVLVYAIFYHPNVTVLFVPKQIFAGVTPWWEAAAMTSSSFYHLGWMFGGLFLLMFLNDCFDGLPFQALSGDKSGSVWAGLVSLIIAVGGGFLFMYIAESIMNYFWFEPFTGGNYTDDPRFRHLHTAEIAAFFMLALIIVKVFFNNVVRTTNRWLNYAARLVAIPAVGMALYFFYYSETLGPTFVDRVPGVGSVDDTSLCWTVMTLALILVYDRFFNAFPLRQKSRQ